MLYWRSGKCAGQRAGRQCRRACLRHGVGGAAQAQQAQQAGLLLLCTMVATALADASQADG